MLRSLRPLNSLPERIQRSGYELKISDSLKKYFCAGILTIGGERQHEVDKGHVATISNCMCEKCHTTEMIFQGETDFI